MNKCQAMVTSLWPHNKPDFDRVRRVLLRQGLPDRVPFIELFADPEVVAAVLEEKPIYGVEDRRQWAAQLEQRIRFCQTVGYDYVWAVPRVDFYRTVLLEDDTALLPRPQRRWVDESEGVISTAEDFEAYPWPTPDTVDYFELEYVTRHLPDGMRIVGCTAGILEWVMWLMGFVPFAIALHDQPGLVEQMFQQIGDLFAAIYQTLVGMTAVAAVFLGDDMGYKTGPFIKPEHLRRYVFPQQRRLAEIAHAGGLPFLLHSCGDLRLVMEDLIRGVGIDGKHSYEDAIMTVQEAKRLYGDRIAILGGVDVDLLARGSEDEVRAHTRRVLEACMPGGGYALGTGNSVANYIPARNYLAMLDEGMKVGRYH